MEAFCLPLNEINDRFTWSEVVLMGWRSQEQSQQFKKKGVAKGWEEPVEAPKRRKQYDGHVPDNLPDRFFDEEGAVNLSKVSLKDALKYMNLQGFKFPMVQGSVRTN